MTLEQAATDLLDQTAGLRDLVRGGKWELARWQAIHLASALASLQHSITAECIDAETAVPAADGGHYRPPVLTEYAAGKLAAEFFEQARKIATTVTHYGATQQVAMVRDDGRVA